MVYRFLYIIVEVELHYECGTVACKRFVVYPTDITRLILNIDGMVIDGEDDVLGEQSVPAPFSLLQMAPGLLSPVRNRQLTA